MTEAFPESAAEFYAKRDDRTNRCVTDRAYQSVGCVVSADPKALETPTGQALFATACNLLSRWCRRVELLQAGGDPPVLLKFHPSAPDELLYASTLALMHDADPFGAFEVVAEPSGECRLQLHVGSQPTRYAEHLVAATAHGWNAGLATNTDPVLEFSCDGNLLGAIGSACISGAQLFKLAVGHDLLIKDGIFDLFSLQRLESPSITDHPQFGRDIGRLLLVGAGSVGSAAAYFMHLAGLTAEIAIVEGDSVKIENFNRSPVFGKTTYALNKGRALEQFLHGTSIAVADVFEGWWEDFIRQRGRTPNGYDIWLPLANEFGVRWSIQNNYPPLMVHASTGANWNANFGHHIFLVDDCLVDRFPEKAPDNSLACATGEVTTPTESIDAALPFLSFFAGFLVATELCRLNAPGYPQVPNYGLLDFGGPMEIIQAWNRKPAETCLCKKQSSSIYRRLNGNTRYAYLMP
jgi:hypothetical protein